MLRLSCNSVTVQPNFRIKVNNKMNRRISHREGEKMSAVKGIRIMLVDDEPHILQFLEIGLVNEGYEVKTAPDGMSAVTLAHDFQPHVVILDVMMPGVDGFEACRMIKKIGFTVAIIMLTAKDEIDDRVKGLTLGADDYMVKPFSFDELLARIQARLRNQFPSLLGEVILGPFQIDDRRKEIIYEQRVLELSPTEYELLKFIVINHGIVLSKTKILDTVWSYDFGGEDNIVEVYIRSLREKLNDKEHRLIRTFRGAGYRIDLP
jgi:two-component system OmpR family response regulator